MFAYIFICVYIYVWIYIYVYIYTCVCIYVCVHMYIYVYVMCRSKSRSKSRTRSHFTTRSGVCKRDLYTAKETYICAKKRMFVDLTLLLAQVCVKDTYIQQKRRIWMYIHQSRSRSKTWARFTHRSDVCTRDLYISKRDVYMCKRSACLCIYKRTQAEEERGLVLLISEVCVKNTYI